jgi:hypothetical protein
VILDDEVGEEFGAVLPGEGDHVRRMYTGRLSSGLTPWPPLRHAERGNEV